MTILYWYLLSCVVVYVVLVVRNPTSFKDVDFMSIVRGVIGVLFYPITLAYLYFSKD